MPMTPRLLVVITALSTALAVCAGPAGASAPEPAVVTVTAPAAHAGETTTVTVTVTAQGGPVVGGQVVVERLRAGEWRPVADVVTDGAGRATATVTVMREPENNQVRATVAATDQ